MAPMAHRVRLKEEFNITSANLFTIFLHSFLGFFVGGEVGIGNTSCSALCIVVYININRLDRREEVCDLILGHLERQPPHTDCVPGGTAVFVEAAKRTAVLVIHGMTVVWRWGSVVTTGARWALMVVIRVWGRPVGS